MNLRYLNPKAKDYPNVHKKTFMFGKAVCVAFNRRGTLLASGLGDGSVAVFDFETMVLVKVLKQHTKPISSLMWSRNGRKLLSSCKGGEVCMWHVLEGTLDYRFVEAQKKPIIHASLNTRNTRICCATPEDAQPYLITVLDNKRMVLKRLQLVVKARQKNSKLRPELNVLGVFSRGGKTVICGSSKGRVTELQFPELKILKTKKVSKALIKQIKVSRCGKYLLVNAQDRTIRVMSTENFTVLQEYTNPLDRHHWQACAFSGNSEFILGCPAVSSARNIHVWSRHYGTMLTCIGTDANHLVDLEFHPVRPICVSVSQVGHIWVWGQPSQPQQWCAYDAEFTELTENTKFYPDPVKSEADRLRRALELRKPKLDEDIDIITKDPIAAFSDDEDENFTPEIDSLRKEIVYLPSIPIPDDEQMHKQLHHSHMSNRHNNASTITYVLSFGEKKRKRKITNADETSSRKKQKTK